MVKGQSTAPYLFALALLGCVPGAADIEGGGGGVAGGGRTGAGGFSTIDNRGGRTFSGTGGSYSPFGTSAGGRRVASGGGAGAVGLGGVAGRGGGFAASPGAPNGGAGGAPNGGAGGAPSGGAPGLISPPNVGGSDPGGARAACPDAATAPCTTATWPGGVVRYAFASGFARQQEVRASMDRWEAASANAVRFVEDATRTAKVIIGACSGPAEAPSYATCGSGCTAAMCGSIDHQLGHVIGLGHEHQRFDRDHYLRLQSACSSAVPRCDAADRSNDFGPFDYASSMLYPVTDATESRWDGSPICGGSATSGCSGAVNGPGGAPTRGDGSAVIELYASAWTRFVRTDTSGASSLSPFSDDVAPGTSIPKDASPAVESWEGNSLAIYVRASDGSIYKKWVDPTTDLWSVWMSLGAPKGSGPVSDPAITSSEPGRSDVVVVRNGKVYIMSTPTWNDWQALPTPPVAPASAPAITSWGPDRLDVFVRGADNEVYHESCTANCAGAAGEWSAWDVLPGGLVKSRPAAIARAKGVIDVFVHGMDDYLWTTHYSDGSSQQWNGFSRLDTGTALKWDADCPDCCAPAATSHDGTTADVFVRTNDDHVAAGSVGPGGWTGYTVLGGVTSGAPGTVAQARTSNRWDLVIVMPEENDAGELHYGTWWKWRS